MGEKISFRDEICNLLSSVEGNPIDVCIQCGTCSASCPAVEYMEYSPRQIIAMIRANMKDEVLGSDTIWCCSSCYNCTVRCPRQIKITEMMYGLKRYSIWRGKYKKDEIGPNFSKEFIDIIISGGKSFEPGLAPTFILKYGIKGIQDNVTMAMNLIAKGRMTLLPPKIKRIENFRKVLGRIIPMK